MRVTPIVGRKGDVICHLYGVTGIFDRHGARPEAGVPIEVMLCAPIMPRADNPDVNAYELPIRTFIVQPVTDDHILVNHKGFECHGTMCCTDASVPEHDSRLIGGVCYLTPGRTPVYEVSNVNVGWDGRKRRTPVPGRAYISRIDLKDGLRRIAGVPDISELDPWIISRMRKN